MALPFSRNLKRLGIEANVRLVDSAQYQERTDSRDFDVIIASWGQSQSPGNEQRDFWSSQAAIAKGSRNFIGINSQVIDELIELVIMAPTRKSQIPYRLDTDHQQFRCLRKSYHFTFSIST